jgi:WbqC-like protein family
MKVGIMQPYLFPYIGYYQLINAVDTFVIYDDVNFIKQGWINRNRILLNNNAFMLKIILKGASSFKKINEIEIDSNKDKIIDIIDQAYRKAPYFKDIYPLLINILLDKETNLAKYLTNNLKTVIEYLGILVSVLVSSEIEKNSLLKGEDKVIDICKRLKATDYINAIGGQGLYSKEKFAHNGLMLNFIKSKQIIYPQFNYQFVPALSIIDIMMFNPKEQILKMLNQYELI